MSVAPTRCRRPYPLAPGARPGNPEAPGMWCRPIPRLRCLTCSWRLNAPIAGEKRGGQEGVFVFRGSRGGVKDPPLDCPKLQDLVHLNDLRVVPAGVDTLALSANSLRPQTQARRGLDRGSSRDRAQDR